MNPRYYDRMSELLNDLIKQRQQEALTYKQYLEQLIALAQQVGTQESSTPYPAWANTGAKRALLDFGMSEDLAVAVDLKIMETKLDRWVGDPMKERKVKRALRQVAGSGFERLDELFDLIKARDEYR
jgi:type I restriction enzyme R subunit